MALFRVNANVDDLVLDEIVDVDPDLFADYIEASLLSPCNAKGERLSPDGGVLSIPTGLDAGHDDVTKAGPDAPAQP